jgi:hypothetical protein
MSTKPKVTGRMPGRDARLPAERAAGAAVARCHASSDGGLLTLVASRFGATRQELVAISSANSSVRSRVLCADAQPALVPDVRRDEEGIALGKQYLPLDRVALQRDRGTVGAGRAEDPAAAGSDAKCGVIPCLAQRPPGAPGRELALARSSSPERPARM